MEKDVLSHTALEHIKPRTDGVRIRDAKKRSVNAEGSLDLVVHILGREETINLNVVERSATEVIIGCDYCNKHFDAPEPRQLLVEVADGKVVPNIRKTPLRHKNAIPLPDVQALEPGQCRNSKKISVVTPTTPQPESDNAFTVSISRHGLITIEPHESIKQRHRCLTAAGISQVNLLKLSKSSLRISLSILRSFTHDKASKSLTNIRTGLMIRI